MCKKYPSSILVQGVVWGEGEENYIGSSNYLHSLCLWAYYKTKAKYLFFSFKFDKIYHVSPLSLHMVIFCCDSEYIPGTINSIK